MAKAFPGFSTKMQTFFRGLARHNSREWFTPRKAVFEQEVRGPMVELVTLVNEDLKRFAVDNAVGVPAKAIYRIYRDTRFSKDKTPYKTHVGATFPRKGLPKHAGAGFYFGVSHEHVEVAGGMYMPGPEELAAIRAAIAGEPKKFAKLIGGVDKKKMGFLMGEKLKRPPKGYEDAPAEAGEWLKFKQLYFYVMLEADVALTPRVRREVVSRFEEVAGVLAWMNEVILAARGEGEDERPVRPEPMW